MATGFDFEEFYVDEKLRTEAAIDRSGVNVQNPTEQAEAVTNNVVYYVSAVEAVRADGTVAPLSADQRVLVESLTSDGSVAGEQYYVRPWHPLGEVAFTGIDPEWESGKERESAFRAQPSSLSPARGQPSLYRTWMPFSAAESRRSRTNSKISLSPFATLASTRGS